MGEAEPQPSAEGHPLRYRFPPDTIADALEIALPLKGCGPGGKGLEDLLRLPAPPIHTAFKKQRQKKATENA